MVRHWAPSPFVCGSSKLTPKTKENTSHSELITCCKHSWVFSQIIFTHAQVQLAL
jgi:hypothetical protein